MFKNQVWLSPQELVSIPADAIVFKGKLLLPEKSWELPDALHEGRARFVVMGNILFNKDMKV